MNKSRNNRYINNFIKDKQLILVVIGIILFWSIIYLFAFYKPKYISNAKVLIKDNSTESFVADLETGGEMRPLTAAGNPLLTQIELLKSHQLASYLFAYMQEKYPELVKDVKNKDAFVGNLINANNKIGTDILAVSLKWTSPENAQEFLKVALREYQNINLDINKEIRANRRKYIESKLLEIEKKLVSLRNRIKQYREGTLAINLEEESKGLVNQKINFASRLEEVNASINSTQHSIREMQQQLSLKTNEAIDAVALGSENKNLVDLRAKLDETSQQYAFDLVKNADTNPKMVALKNQIDTIKSQIQNQVRLTLGKSKRNNNVHIFDPVRTKLVSDLAAAQTNLMSLKAEKRSLMNSIAKINSNQSYIPAKKYTLDNLEQEERNLSAAYDELRKKQIEARIKEAEAVSNIVIVDEPSLPANKSFPTNLHIILMALALGTGLGFVTSGIKTYIEDVCEGIDAVEETSGKSVIGVVPWFDNKIGSMEERMIYGMAYGNIMSNLMIKCYKNNAKVLTFSTNNIKKNNSKTVYTIASEFIKLGHTVAVIDCDFRVPTLHKEAGITNRINTNLSDVILVIEKKLKHKRNLPQAVLSVETANRDQDGIVSVQTSEKIQHMGIDNQASIEIVDAIRDAIIYDKNGVAMLVNRTAIKDPYEYFGTNAFNIIIQKLKENFDWVLIETPSVTMAPETLLISTRSDVFTLITSLKITYSTLNKVRNMLRNAEVPFLGCIIRDKDVNVKEHLDFLK